MSGISCVPHKGLPCQHFLHRCRTATLEDCHIADTRAKLYLRGPGLVQQPVGLSNLS